MVKQWHDMTRDVLMAKGRELAPVTTEAAPHLNREWTDYDAPLTGGEAKRKKGKAKSKSAANLPRARKDTKLTVEGDQLILQSTGSDPGLAFEQLKLDSPGAYTLEFRLQSKASGSGELYWTTNAETILPKGKHLDFEVKRDGEWHEVKLLIEEAKTLHAFRLDPLGGEGEARVEGLVLKAEDGKVLARWP